MDYEWDRYTSPYLFQQILEKNHDWLIQDFQTSAAEWWEREKFLLQSEGEARAIRELAFRDAIISEKSEKMENSEKFFWITINPRPGVSLPELMKVQEKMISKKWIQSYAYVYENTDKGHIHTHTLIKAEYEPSRARKEIASTAKSICDVSNVHIFKFVVLDAEKAKQKLSYMLGNKKPNKMQGVDLTTKWRVENHLKKIYSSKVPLSCWDLGKGILKESQDEMNSQDQMNSRDEK